MEQPGIKGTNEVTQEDLSLFKVEVRIHHGSVVVMDEIGAEWKESKWKVSFHTN